MDESRNVSLQYLAGFFDGEGCIVIGKRAPRGLPIYTLVTCVTNTYRPLIDELSMRFGASTTQKNRIYRVDIYSNKNIRPCFQWHAASDVAEQFLRAIYPHLVIKRQEAELAFEFREHVRRYKYVHSQHHGSWLKSVLYQQIQIEREAMYQKMMVLKRPEFEGMVAKSGKLQTGQSRAKQESVDTSPGVCNEHGLPAKAKMCSGLNGNIESVAEMTSPHLKVVGNKTI